MLDIARERCAQAGLSQRVDFHCSPIEALESSTQWDAAICLFVLHFLSGIELKSRFLQSINTHAQEGASLLLADCMHSDAPRDLQTHGIVSTELGQPPQRVKSMLTKLKSDFIHSHKMLWILHFKEQGGVLRHRTFSHVDFMHTTRTK